MHVHVAPGSLLCPARVVGVAVRGWGTVCAESCPQPCRLLTSLLLQTMPASAEGTFKTIVGSCSEICAWEAGMCCSIKLWKSMSYAIFSC